jgi:hypothetical protein
MSRSSFAIQLEEEEGKDKTEADGEAGDAAEVASPGPKLGLLKKKHTLKAAGKKVIAMKRAATVVRRGRGFVRSSIPVETVWLWLRRRKREMMLGRLALYLVFVSLFVLLTDLTRNSRDAYSLQQGLVHNLVTFPDGNYKKTFDDIVSDDDFFHWAQKVLIPVSLSETYYNGDSKFDAMDGLMRESIGYSRLTMPIRFRQARVRVGSCVTPEFNSRLIAPCWGPYSDEAEDKAELDGAAAYGGQYREDLGQVSGKAGFGADYGTRGHTVDVPLHLGEASEKLEEMRAGRWVDEATRGVSVETVWHNANIGLTSYLRFHVDISPGGRYQTSIFSQSLRLFPYETSWDYIRAGLEIIFCLILCFYILKEVQECREDGLKVYFSSWENIFEVMNLSLYVYQVSYWALFILSERNVFGAEKPSEYVDITALLRTFAMAQNAASMNIVWSFVKVFKYLQVQPEFLLLWQTIETAMSDIVPFLVVLALFSFGFAFAGHWLFGHTVLPFHSFQNTWSTLLRTLNGGMPLEQMRGALPRSGPLFAVLWILLMVMVLKNLAMAILAETYGDVSRLHRTEQRALSMKTGSSDGVGLFKGLQLRRKAKAFKVDENDVDNPESDGGIPDGQIVPIPRTGPLRLGKRENTMSKSVFHPSIEAKEMVQLVQNVDMREIGTVKMKVLRGEKMSIEELLPVFYDDKEATSNFCEHASTLQRKLAEPLQAREVEEFETLHDLQQSMSNLSKMVNHMRDTLYDMDESEEEEEVESLPQVRSEFDREALPEPNK